MKTHPDPLQPMRHWRELWQPLSAHPVPDKRAQLHAPRPKQQKQPSFHWLNHLLNDDSRD